MEVVTFVARDFEGPLDLLLHLISKHKLNIVDIEISSLLKQYLAYIEERKIRNLELDSSFIEMAARLIQIKTATLLPKHEDEAKELKGQLTAELMEYQACKLAASMLFQRWEQNICYTGKPTTMEHDSAFTGRIPLELLLKATGVPTLVAKKKVVNPQRITEIIEKRVISIGSRIINLMRKLFRNGNISYDDAFADARSKSHLVATFLGILEMVKAGRIKVEDNQILLLQKKDMAPKTEDTQN